LVGAFNMAGITMCTNILCPKKLSCYRAIAEPSDQQSYSLFKYTTGENGVECDKFLLARNEQSNNTVDALVMQP